MKHRYYREYRCPDCGGAVLPPSGCLEYPHCQSCRKIITVAPSSLRVSFGESGNIKRAIVLTVRSYDVAA